MIDRKNRTITHNYHTEHFPLRPAHSRDFAPGSRFDAFCHLILHEFSRERLFNYIYGGNADGGPLMGYWVWDIRFAQWKPVMKRLGLKLIRWKVAGTMYFRLVPDVV
jgi:hypothetical protein